MADDRDLHPFRRAAPDGPVFDEGWQAQALSLAVNLSERGCFTWAEWSEALGATLRAAADRGDPDVDGRNYYQHWLATLEALVIRKSLAHRDELDELKAAWTSAYAHTPHGQPVELDPARR